MIQINQISFTYGKEGGAGGVQNIDLSIPDGQVVVLCGESGCGKTTLTRLINGLIPHYYEGELTGNVVIDGQDVSKQPLYDTARLVGSVFQNPRSQFFNVDTTSEISFGCENLGMPEDEIRKRLSDTVSSLHMEKLLNRNIFALSGGEKQKIACAGAFIMQPQVFVLDEPSSNLDADSILMLRRIIAYWKSLGKTIVLSEHRIYYLQGIADRFVYLKDGQIAGDYTDAQFEALSDAERRKMGLRAPSLNALTVPDIVSASDETAHLSDFHFSYKHGPERLHIADGDIPYNGIIGIIGSNGAGKSTFSRCFCGLERRCGTVTVKGTAYRPKDRLNACYMVMQDVGHQLFTESVLDEVLISMENEDAEAAKKILDALDLLPFCDRHPMSLSGGQKQRVAIASSVASKRPVIFLDEPTSGLDYKHMLEVTDILKTLHDSGKTVYVITHDPELICACCTDIIHLSDGDIRDCYPMGAEGLSKIRDFFRITMP